MAGFLSREDGAFVLREDGSKVLREGAVVATRVLASRYPGQRVAMTGDTVSASGYEQNQAIRVVNATGDDIFVCTDGAAALSTGESMVIPEGSTEITVIQNVGGTISMIGASTVGYVYLLPLNPN
jgi:hypothetical protein